MDSIIKRISILALLAGAVAFGMFLAGGLNIGRNANGDSAAPFPDGRIYDEGDPSAKAVSFAELAKMANPAVVNVQATSRSGSTDIRGRDFDIFDFFFDVPERRNQPIRGFGSGFIISPDGYILTNFHVVSNKSERLADDIKVILYDDEESYKARVVGADSELDVVLLKIEPNKKLPYLKIGDSDKAEVGEWVMAIGNPSLLENTVTVGVVSAKGRQVSGSVYKTFIQTDAAINMGNSGGPLINMKSEVIGINSLILYNTEGIGFAISINSVKDIIPQLKEKGFVSRGYIGVLPSKITRDLQKSLDLPTNKGAFIDNVTAGGAADKAGMKAGDIMVEFDGKTIESLEDLYRTIALSKPGKETTMKIIRNKKEMTLDITPDERSGAAATSKGKDKDNEEYTKNIGLTVADITSLIRRRLGIPDDIKGVIVTNVAQYSLADDAGLAEGMVIQKINRKNINNVDDYRRELKSELKDSRVVAFYVAQPVDRYGNWMSRYVTINLAQ